MEILIGIIGLVLTILIALIPYFKKKYGDRPKLEIEINMESGSSLPIGLSHKNDTSNGYIEIVDVIQIFEVQWKMNLRIRNFSDLAAYYTKLSYMTDSPMFTALDKLPNKPT